MIRIECFGVRLPSGAAASEMLYGLDFLNQAHMISVPLPVSGAALSRAAARLVRVKSMIGQGVLFNWLK